jgi:hypothetical protein
MTENLDLAHLSVSDREQLEEMNDDRYSALSASTTLANESHEAAVRDLDQLEQLVMEEDEANTLDGTAFE